MAPCGICLLPSVDFNLQSTDPFDLNFQSLEVVSRYRDTQLQVTENLCDL